MRSRRRFSPPCLWLFVLLLAPVLAAAPAAAKKKRAAPAAAESADSAPQSLADLTEGAEAFAGLFTLYQREGKMHLAVPQELEGVELGFAAIQVGAMGDFALRGGSLDSGLVRWQRAGDHLMLVKENLSFRADADSPMAAVLERSFLDSPVFTARLVPVADDPAPLVVDASRLFGPDLARLMPESSGFSAGPDDAMVASIRAFPDNVVVRVIYRLRGSERGGGEDASGFARFLAPSRLPDSRVAEMTVDYHFYRLPEDDFEPRFADDRIGGFVDAYKEFTRIDDRDTLFRHLLTRWDVREPITFTMDRSVPERWRPLVRSAALWWNSAFEKIGIDNAVRVLDPPDDPDWDPADLRHNVIYWNIADNLVFSGAAGPTLSDPRNGKVLKATVWLNGEFFSFALHRYLVYAWWRAPEPGAAGEAVAARRQAMAAIAADGRRCDRAASFSSQIAFARLVLAARGIVRPGTPEADRFAREAFEELVAHEVGHALGFPHNWKASLVASWEDVREGRVTGRRDDNPFSTSVMEYDPIYLAPRGAPQGDYFMREVGAYDELAVEYLYRPLDGLAAAERARALDAIAARAETEYGMIYDGGELSDIDPTSNADDFSDDPLAFAESRLAILQEEVLPRLPELVLAEGHDYSLLRQALDAAIFSVAMDYIDMTARQVGGQELLRRVAQSPAAAEGGPPPITPVAAERQRRALTVLERRLFADGAFALSPETMARLKADLQFDWNYPWRYASDYNLGARISGLYEAALATLLDPARLARVLDNERRVPEGGERFTLPELFARLEAIAFSDLGRPLSADRRALQRRLLDHLRRLVLEPGSGTPAEASQLAADSLASIAGRIQRANPDADATEPYTRAHLRALAAEIAKTLAAGYQRAVGG